MKQMKEQEKLRERLRYQKKQQKDIEQATKSMKVSQIKCMRMNFCNGKDTPQCFSCSYNLTKPIQNPSVDYYRPKIPGLKFL